MKIDAEQIEQHAELGACFLRALLTKSIPIQAAVQLTQTYLMTRINIDVHQEKPKDPWEGDSPT